MQLVNRQPSVLEVGNKELRELLPTHTLACHCRLALNLQKLVNFPTNYNEPSHEKIKGLCFQPGLTHTGQVVQPQKEARSLKFKIRKKQDNALSMEQKQRRRSAVYLLHSIFAYAYCWFSYAMAQLLLAIITSNLQIEMETSPILPQIVKDEGADHTVTLNLTFIIIVLVKLFQRIF